MKPAVSRAAFACAIIAAAIVAACRPSSAPSAKAKEAPPTSGPHAGVVRSNVRFDDYAGSNACARCHFAEAESWARSPMHNMTREAKTADVKGRFDGSVFRFHGDTAKFESAGSDRFVTLESKRYGGGIYKVTRIIGGHHREDYAGTLVPAVREGVQPAAAEPEERVLPVSFMLATRSFRYKGYSVMVKERDGLKIGAVWSQTCIFCHNTEPYLSTVLGALVASEASGGATRRALAGTSLSRHEAVYQGEVVDPLLPEALRASYVVTDEHALASVLEREMRRLGGSGKPTLRDAIATTRSRFSAKHLVEVGIGCESCHLGSAEHVRDPSRLPSFEPASDAFQVRLPAASRAASLNRVCARCHQVLFSGYDPTWEGGSRKRSPGGSHINSGEARDLMLGACASKLACVDCHDPHAPDATTALRAADAARSDALCTRCHSSMATPDALRAHSHHDPTREGARCVACHMPKKNMSLDGGLSRYHRIGSPTDAAKVLLDRPLECALCHVDKNVGSLVGTMEKWWSKSFDRGALVALYGSLDANVMLATAERGKPHEQAVAFQSLGDARVNAALPVLAGQLTHPYPIVRGYAKRAIDGIRGSVVPIDIDAPDEEIEAQAKHLR